MVPEGFSLSEEYQQPPAAAASSDHLPKGGAPQASSCVTAHHIHCLCSILFCTTYVCSYFLQNSSGIVGMFMMTAELCFEAEWQRSCAALLGSRTMCCCTTYVLSTFE